MRKNRFLSVLLSICMLLALLPLGSMTALRASAEDYSMVLNEEAPIPAGTTKISFTVSDGSWVGIYTAANAASASYSLYVDYVDKVVTGEDGTKTVTFPSNVSVRMRYDNWRAGGGIAAGDYCAVLFADGGYGKPVVTVNFTVDNSTVETEPTSFAGTKSSFAVGEGVTFTYENSQYSKDWIAIYPEGSGSYISSGGWQYTPNASGSVTFDASWVNTPGNYTARYYQNDTQYVRYGEFKFSIVETGFSAVSSMVEAGNGVSFAYQNSTDDDDCIAVYNASGTECLETLTTAGTSGTVTFFGAWTETVGSYTAKYYADDTKALCFGETTVTVKEAKVEVYDGAYYIRYGGTGDGSTLETPAGSVDTVIQTINDAGHGAGSSVLVYLIPSEEPSVAVGAPITEDNFKFVSLYTTKKHDAKITFTTYNYKNSEQNYAAIAIYGSFNPMHNEGIRITGPTVFKNILLLDTRNNYRTDINAQGYDLEFDNIVRRRVQVSGDTFSIVNNAKTALYSNSNRGGLGTVGEGGRITVNDGSQFDLYYGGWTEADGHDETFENDTTFEVNGTTVSKVVLAETQSGRVLNFKKSVNLVLNGSTVTTFSSSQPSIVEGAIQILLNNGSSVGTFTAASKATVSDGGDATPVYMMESSGVEGALDVTDTAGSFKVLGGKIAYVQSEDLNTVYYGAETLTVPAGTHTVTYASSMEEILANIQQPDDIDQYNLFDKWVDDGNGTIRASYAYSIPVYYVSATGSDENDGLTVETPLATTTAAIDKLNGSDGVIYCIGNVTFTDKAHAGRIFYESYEGGTIAGASNVIRLAGPTVLNADFRSSQNIYTNGFYLELGGTVDSTKRVELLTVGNEEGKDETLVIKGKFVFKMVTRIPGQTTGNVNITIDGGVLRQMSTGSGTSGDGSYTVGGVSVTVISGEFWCLNHTDSGPHKATGAFEYIANGNSYYFDPAKQLFFGNPNYPISIWTDFTPGGTGGFPKIQFDGGKWVIRSADTNGNVLQATETPGTYSYSGTKTPYYITENGLNVYYGKDGTVHLPTGIIDVLWIDGFSADKMPEPTLAEGYEFGGWRDDGNGLLTAQVTNPDYYYVSDSGSDTNMGTKDAPFKSIAKAIESFGGKNGIVYVLSSATYDSDAVAAFDGRVVITGADAGAVLNGSDITVQGNTKIDNLTLSGNTVFRTNGNRLELGEVTAEGLSLQFITGSTSASGTDKLVLPVISGAKVDIAVGEDGVSVGTQTTVVLKGTTVDTLSVTCDNADANIRVDGENGAVIGTVEKGTSKYNMLEVIMNGTAQKIEAEASGSDRYIYSNSSDGRIDLSSTAGAYGIQSVSGKVPVAVSSDGTAYAASDYTTQDIAPDTWYKTNQYANYINYRKPLANTYSRLTQDKELNVVYFGGSVTVGYGSSNNNLYSWRALIGQWLVDNFPEATVHNINRGSGESGTYLGTYRVQRDVISLKPDLLFLEYSINDKYYGSSYDKAKSQYETIVREVKEALPNCDIVTILVTDSGCLTLNRQGSLHTQAQAHEDMAKIYNIPSLHVGRVLADKLPGDTASGWSSADWSKYAIDSVHLNDAGNYVYYDCIREFMYNSLFCTDYTGLPMRHDELVPVQSEALFDGNRTVIQPTAELIAQSEALGGTGFTYSSDLYGLYDYYGIATASSTDSIFAFEFDGTDAALMSNFYNNSYLYISIDDGDYVKKECSGHSPTKIVEDLTPGKHVIRFKPSFGTASGAPQTLKIGAIFTRDSSKATVQGTTYQYADQNNYSLTAPAGSYEMVYASTVGDLPVKSAENLIFLGWKNEKGEAVAVTDGIEPGAVLYPQYVDVNEYFTFKGVQIRVGNEQVEQGLRFVVDKKASLEDAITVKDYGMVVIPSAMLGDTRSYTDYDSSVENCLSNIVGAADLFIGSTHEYKGQIYSSAEVKAVKILAQLADGVRYTTCITGIGEESYSRYYTLKPYVRYTVNGVDYVAYADAFRSSTYEVAKAIQSYENASEEEKAIAAAIVESVEKAQ